MTNETQQKTTDLAKLEKVIAKGQKAFMETAKAVSEIIDNRLFAPGWANFSAYFAERWSMSASVVSRYRAAAAILVQLEGDGLTVLPENEGQARALHEIKDPTRRLDVWKAAVESSKPISGNLIRELANPSPTVTPKVEVQDQTSDLMPTTQPVAVQVPIIRPVLRAVEPGQPEFHVVSHRMIGDNQMEFVIESSDGETYLAVGKPGAMSKVA